VTAYVRNGVHAAAKMKACSGPWRCLLLQRRPPSRGISPTSAHARVEPLPACLTKAPRSPRTVLHLPRPPPPPTFAPMTPTNLPYRSTYLRRGSSTTERRASRLRGVEHYSLLATRAVARRRVHARRGSRSGAGVSRGLRRLGVPVGRGRRARCCRRRASWCGGGRGVVSCRLVV
jgi:hypothetical protein